MNYLLRNILYCITLNLSFTISFSSDMGMESSVEQVSRTEVSSWTPEVHDFLVSNLCKVTNCLALLTNEIFKSRGPFIEIGPGISPLKQYLDDKGLAEVSCILAEPNKESTNYLRKKYEVQQSGMENCNLTNEKTAILHNVADVILSGGNLFFSNGLKNLKDQGVEEIKLVRTYNIDTSFIKRICIDKSSCEENDYILLPIVDSDLLDNYLFSFISRDIYEKSFKIEIDCLNPVFEDEFLNFFGLMNYFALKKILDYVRPKTLEELRTLPDGEIKQQIFEIGRKTPIAIKKKVDVSIRRDYFNEMSFEDFKKVNGELIIELLTDYDHISLKKELISVLNQIIKAEGFLGERFTLKEYFKNIIEENALDHGYEIDSCDLFEFSSPSNGKKMGYSHQFEIMRQIDGKDSLSVEIIVLKKKKL